MVDEIVMIHSAEAFEEHLRKQKLPERDEYLALLIEEASMDNYQGGEKIMAAPKITSEGTKPDMAQSAKTETTASYEKVSEDLKLSGDLLQHLKSTKMTAGQLDLLLDKLTLQFDQLLHGKLVGQLKHTDNYTFAKEYLDMDIQPMKDVIERMKQMIGMLQEKQITLYDDMLDAKKETDGKLLKVKEEMLADIERQNKTINAKIDHEIQRNSRGLDEQVKSLRNEISESAKKEHKATEDGFREIKSKVEEDLGKLKDSLTSQIKQDQEKLENESKRLTKEFSEMKEKVQKSLRTLSDYMLLVIDAASLKSKIEKLSYDRDLDDMKTINL